MIQNIQDLYKFLGSSQDELNHILINIKENYRQHSQPKIKFGQHQKDDYGRIRLRHLLIPSDRLYFFQKKINELLRKINLPGYMYGCLPGKNHVLNAGHHLNQNYFLTIDLKNFFTNINHRQVFSMLVKNGFSTPVSKLLTKLSTYNKSLPQGSPSSPAVANLVFLETANKLATLAKSCDIRFSCFLDDLTFSSKRPFKHLVPTILDMIKLAGFFPSQSKISYRVGTCEVTGLIIRQNKLHVVRQMREEAKTNPSLNRYVRSIDLLNKKMDEVSIRQLNSF